MHKSDAHDGLDAPPPTAFSRLTRRGFILTLAALSIVLVWRLSHTLADLRFGDALISLRYGRNIATGNGFVFNPGERVLGVTSPLQAILAAIATAVSPVHAPVVINIIGIGFLVLTSWMAALLVRKYYSPSAGLLTGLLLVSNLNLTYLYVGMEVPLFAFLILLAFRLFLSHREFLLGLVLGMAFLTRYDAALLAALVGLDRWVRKKALPWRLILGFFGVVTPWLIFAQWYFDGILPTPLGAKQGHTDTATYLREVCRYYLATFAHLGARCGVPPVAQPIFSFIGFLVVGLGIRRALREQRGYAMLLLYTALHLLTYGLIGADPRFRWHYFILNPVLFIFFAVGFCEMLSRLLDGLLSRVRVSLGSSGRRWCLLGLSCLLSGPLAADLYRAVQHPYRPDPYTRDMYAIACWIDARYDDRATLMNPSIGILGYETNLRMVDHAGLVTAGLYYLDGRRHTPLNKVLQRYEPELILLPDAVPFDAAANGYRVRKAFPLQHPYILYEAVEISDVKKVPKGPHTTL